MIHYPHNLKAIFDKLENSAIRAVIIGGFIRDSLLNISSKDIDIEVYGISSFTQLENILREFGDVNSVGKSFGVCKLKFEDYELDFSFPRVDNKIREGHRGFEVEVNPNLDFKTASRRRDFTINAIGYDVIEKEILDPYNGIDDLNNKILKAVDKGSFIEDPLRVLRAAQFCARFNLKIEESLFSLCREMVKQNMLDELPKERLYEELKKLLLMSHKPSIGFKLLKDFGTDIYTKNISVTDEISKQLTNNEQTNLVLMFAGLCYDYDSTETANFIHKITDEKKLLNRVLELTGKHNEIDNIYKNNMNTYSLYKLAAKVKIDELLILSRAIYSAQDSSKAYEAGTAIYKKAKELNILREKLPPLLRGEDILVYGIEPSPEFSIILNRAYEAQINSEFNSHKMAIKWLEKYLFTDSSKEAKALNSLSQ